MKQRTVGRSGLKVSQLGLGTMTWGVETDADEAAAQLVAFHDAGGTLVDTAASYGYGESEAILGGLIADIVPRVDLVIATKAGIIRTHEGRQVDASRGALLRRLDESLRKLGTDYIDLWYVHYIDDSVPFEDTLTTHVAGFDSDVSWRLMLVARSSSQKFQAPRWPPRN